MAAHSRDPDPGVRLRGHHLLCAFGFRGMGYDPAHAAHMAGVVRKLLAPAAVVEIVAGLDDICAGCPQRHAARCVAAEHERDLAVLTAVGMTLGHVEPAATLFPAVARRVAVADLVGLCAGCPWYDLGMCAAGLAAGQVAAGWEDAASACPVVRPGGSRRAGTEERGPDEYRTTDTAGCP
jgi:hypothetical protein